MNKVQKNKLMEAKVKAIHDSTIKTEWNRLNKIQDRNMKQLENAKKRKDTRTKPAAARKSKSPPVPASKIPKKKKILLMMILCR